MLYDIGLLLEQDYAAMQERQKALEAEWSKGDALEDATYRGQSIGG